MKIKDILVFLATLGPIGYVRGSGTLATLVTLPFVYLCYQHLHWFYSALVAIAFFIIATMAISKGLTRFAHDHDPSEIVVDEVFGCFVTFYGIPLTLSTVIIGFLLFRFFDIVKPFGIKRLEQIPGVWGVVIDDIVAGLLSNISLYGIYHYCLICL